MKKYRIIIVENDEDEQFFMKKGFDETGLFDILIQARNGNVLLEWLEEHRPTLPDVILSDLNMPGKNGYDILDALKEDPAYARVPVIITSTSSTPSIRDKCLNKGAADYIVKPETFIEYGPYAQQLHTRIEHKQLVKVGKAS
ncbi:response regulator [Spirosoma taeanense]|uniref:Response regulator n=1 Tax=Spirosoma taeanense TaxID=2735870 RepID=A0A6M5Y9J9_9BACT|nr:response regulator [Spirosoma taeanense]QJW90928.1 response regulator [Spirosoma taeanense]